MPIPAPPPKKGDGRAYIDPAALARLRGVSVRAERVVDGILQGSHRSPHQGVSIEFAEHKEYAPGDDTRHIDWKVYGRMDRYVVKKFEQETNLQATFLIDGSGSMEYGAEGMLSKFDYAATMAVSLTYLLLKQQDSVGLVKFAEGVAETLPARARATQLGLMARTLERAAIEGGTNLEVALKHVVEHQRRRGMVFLFSDFFTDLGALRDTLANLVTRGQDVTLFAVFDGDELDFPFRDMTLFEGMEQKTKLLVEPTLMRREYLKRFGAHREAVRKLALDAMARHVELDTREAPGEAILRFLRERRAVATSRGRGA
jgi:uncharacterized protein (DUF58 family)